MTQSQPPKTVFTNEDLIRWGTAALDKTPDVPTKPQALAAIQVQSFACCSTRLGVAVRIAIDNGDPVTMMLNPVLARELRKVLAQAGAQGGWLDAQDRITFPLEDER